MSLDAVVPVAISARHVHLTAASVARLFGPDQVLGVHAPLAQPGQFAAAETVTLVGPAGTITLDHGVVLAKRHIHMTPGDARRFGVHDREIVEVAVDSRGRDLVFGDVVVRVSSAYRLEFHLDTDEGNAAGLHDGGPVRLMTPAMVRAQLRRIVDPKRP